MDLALQIKSGFVSPAEQKVILIGTSLMVYERPRMQYLGTLNTFLERLFIEIPKATSNTDWRVKKLQGFIDSHDGKIGWDLPRICRELGLGISGSHAARLFKRGTGIGVREYAKRQRLKIAAELLKTTTLSVKEIAAHLGYRDPWDFERQFRRLFRLSPTEFRRMRYRADSRRGRNS